MFRINNKIIQTYIYKQNNEIRTMWNILDDKYFKKWQNNEYLLKETLNIIMA